MRKAGFAEKSVFIVIVIVAMVAAFGLWYLQNHQKAGESRLVAIGAMQLDTQTLRKQFPNFLVYPNPKTVDNFSLRNDAGAVIDKSYFKGKYTILTFGFTRCPDVCPTTLMELNLLLKQFPQNQLPPQVVFVAVDPEVDLKSGVSKYVQFYNPNFQGISGEIPQLTAFAANLGALFEKAPLSADEDAQVQIARGDYTMAHTPSLYVIGPSGDLLAVGRQTVRVEQGSTEFDWKALRSEIPAVLALLRSHYGDQ